MKRRVGVLGATGMVGQRFLSLLDYIYYHIPRLKS
jgi:aspartate-semialdehyde dehydrogenase